MLLYRPDRVCHKWCEIIDPRSTTCFGLALLVGSGSPLHLQFSVYLFFPLVINSAVTTARSYFISSFTIFARRQSAKLIIFPWLLLHKECLEFTSSEISLFLLALAIFFIFKLVCLREETGSRFGLMDVCSISSWL